MTQTLTLCLPQATFEALHVAADGRGKKASVKKADLSALLMDHARVRNGYPGTGGGALYFFKRLTESP